MVSLHHIHIHILKTKEKNKMTDKKEKQIIVEQVVVTGYVKHSNGRKTPFSFDKKTLEPKDLESIFIGLKRIYK